MKSFISNCWIGFPLFCCLCWWFLHLKDLIIQVTTWTEFTGKDHNYWSMLLIVVMIWGVRWGICCQRQTLLSSTNSFSSCLHLYTLRLHFVLSALCAVCTVAGKIWKEIHPGISLFLFWASLRQFLQHAVVSMLPARSVPVDLLSCRNKMALCHPLPILDYPWWLYVAGIPDQYFSSPEPHWSIYLLSTDSSPAGT